MPGAAEAEFYQSGWPPPVPQESMSNLSASPARCTTVVNTASAVGLRQMLPATKMGEDAGRRPCR